MQAQTLPRRAIAREGGIGKPGASANLMGRGMKSFLTQLGVTACGLATSVMTALAITTIST